MNGVGRAECEPGHVYKSRGGRTSMLACWVIHSKECVSVCVFGCWYLLEMLDTADGPVLLLPVVIIPSSPSHPRSSKNNKTQDYLMMEAAV